MTITIKPCLMLKHVVCLAPIAVLGLSLPAHSAITIQSYWNLGEGAVGADSSNVNDGELNNFNNTTGTVINTATPSGVNSSTAYATTNGVNFQGSGCLVSAPTTRPFLPTTGEFNSWFGPIPRLPPEISGPSSEWRKG